MYMFKILLYIDLQKIRTSLPIINRKWCTNLLNSYLEKKLFFFLTFPDFRVCTQNF